RVQYENQGGERWDEWICAFEDGRWARLVEQGDWARFGYFVDTTESVADRRTRLRSVWQDPQSVLESLGAGKVAAEGQFPFCFDPHAREGQSHSPLELRWSLSWEELGLGRAAAQTLPLGAQARLFGLSLTVVGQVTKRLQGTVTSAQWSEYALRTSDGNFAWLAESQGHYTFFTATAPFSAEATQFRRDERTFEFFAQYDCVITSVKGQLPDVSCAGQTFTVREFISPPQCFSHEQKVRPTGSNASADPSFLRGIYVPNQAVERAFGRPIPGPVGVGAAQPNPYVNLLREWLVVALVVAALWGGLRLRQGREFVLGRAEYTPLAQPKPAPDPWNPAPTIVPSALFVSRPFQLERGSNIVLRARSEGLKGFVELDGELIRDNGAEVIPVELSFEHYSGSDWEEGEVEAESRHSSPDGGTYVLRAQVNYEDDTFNPMQTAGPTLPLAFTLRQGSPSFAMFGALQLVLAVFPWLGYVLYAMFERRRRLDSGPPEVI
ncbi:MAG TPA: hypothetical protein VLC09_10810, partial [Polyangiaceae bacterium]|nr:hypothetical protein [Polyangiaceae bacterium]